MKFLNLLWWKIISWPFSLLYCVFIQTRNTAFSKHRLFSKQLPVKVISVGNITVGGTGKTPLVEMLASFLNHDGYRVAILSRGYNRKKTKNEVTIISDGHSILTDVKQAGDEPYLLAKNLVDVPVIVCRNRIKAGLVAIEQLGCNLLILDDGFQHRKIKRDIDIVVIDAANPWGNGGLLPAGPLREPIQNLSRSDVIILSHTNEARELEKLIIQIEGLCKIPIWYSNHKPIQWIDLGNSRQQPLCFLEKKCVAAFCGIGNPDSFRRTLASIGVEIIEFFQFRDHHWYSVHDLEKMSELAESKGAVALVTTEKDCIRISLPCSLKIPIYILKIKMELQDDQEAIRSLVKLITSPEKETRI
jgi:tetraacyldisaccharide 4'-kinase